MGRLSVETCRIVGLKVIAPEVFYDERGYFMESYNARDFKEIGIECVFVQDNRSSSTRGVLRGLHFQIEHAQDKLVSVQRGEVFDVAVDIRKGSATYGKWFGIVLSEENKLMFFIPKGFAHGFIVLSERAEFTYKCSDFYYPSDQGGIIYSDEAIGIEWPLQGRAPILSERDKLWGSLSSLAAMP